MRVLIAYYSRTEMTRLVAQAIRDELGCDIERITDRRRRLGVASYLGCTLDSLLGRATELEPLSTDVADYDLVVVGTPVWNGGVATPVRTYLQQNRERFGRVAFFCTYRSHGVTRTFEEMADRSGRAPVVELAVRSRDAARGDYGAKVRAFAAFVERERARSVRPPPTPMPSLSLRA